MLNNKKLMNKLNKEIQELQYKIENTSKYNLKIFPKAIAIKGLINLERISPFILSSIICLGIYHINGKKPFKKEKIIEYANIQHTITSTGYESDFISYDTKYKDNSIIYTTGWYKNEYDLFERIETTYEISDIDLDDIYGLLNLPPEDINNILSVANIEKIQKSNLSKDDEIYQEDMIIIKDTIKDNNYSNVRDETFTEGLFQFLSYLLMSASFGVGLRKVKFMLLKENFTHRLNYLEVKYKIVTPYDIEILKNHLALKIKNLKLLEESEVDKCK